MIIRSGRRFQCLFGLVIHVVTDQSFTLREYAFSTPFAPVTLNLEALSSTYKLDSLRDA